MRSKLLSQGEVGDLLGISTKTLEHWRIEGCGPKFVKLGKRVAYREDEVDRWIDSCQRQSTSESEARRRNT